MQVKRIFFSTSFSSLEWLIFFPIDPFVDRKSSLFINTGVEVLLLVGAKVHMYLLVHMAPQNINLVIKSKILPYMHSLWSKSMHPQGSCTTI